MATGNTTSAIKALDTISANTAQLIALSDLSRQVELDGELCRDTLQNIGTLSLRLLREIDMAQGELQNLIGSAQA